MTVSIRFVGSRNLFGNAGAFSNLYSGGILPGLRFAIDFGTSSLIALNKQGIAHNGVDELMLTRLDRDG